MKFIKLFFLIIKILNVKSEEEIKFIYKKLNYKQFKAL